MFAVWGYVANPSEDLKKKLSELKLRHGGVADFCRKTGFSRQSVENWISGANPPALENLPRIADALDLQPWQLIMPEGEDVVPKSVHEAILRENVELRADLEAAKRLLRFEPTSPLARIQKLTPEQLKELENALNAIESPDVAAEEEEVEVPKKKKTGR